MASDISVYIGKIHNFVQNNKNNSLQNYLKTLGSSQKNFWSGLRSDLLRQTPHTIEEYLLNPKSRLNHAEHANGFGNALYENLFKDKVQEHLAALIYYCLELDAAQLVAESKPEGTNRKHILKSALHLLEVK